MISLSNSLSFIRAPLALLFLQENNYLRVLAIILAMFTDSIDGYLARRYRSASKFGAILDPTMDKFFVYFVLTILYLEGNVKLWQGLAMLSRDFFLCIFGLYLAFSGRWKHYEFRAIRWGKVTTALQFIVMIGLTLDYVFPWPIFASFLLFGALAFIELFQIGAKQYSSLDR